MGNKGETEEWICKKGWSLYGAYEDTAKELEPFCWLKDKK